MKSTAIRAAAQIGGWTLRKMGLAAKKRELLNRLGIKWRGSTSLLLRTLTKKYERKQYKMKSKSYYFSRLASESLQ